MTVQAKRLSSHTAVLILFFVELLAPIKVSAQQPIIPLQFSFSDPGARSMGFGGAFVALADDATAAFSNPAGLTQLLKPEFSIEARLWNYSTPFTEGGRLENLPSGLGIDTTIGLRTANSEYDTTGLSFLSFAYPQENWSFAFFRHELANLKFYSETQGLFHGGTDCCQIRELDHRATSDLDFLSYGVSTAFRLSDRFNVGLGVLYYDTSLKSTATLFLPDDDSVESILGPNSYLPERLVVGQRIFSGGSDWALTAGVLWRFSESWSFGAVYREGPKIGIAAEVFGGAAGDFVGIPPGTVIVAESVAELDLPGILGLGFAYRSADGHLTVSFQWDRVDYSSIPDSLNVDTATVDDADELHLGAEYVFLDSTPIIAVRIGAWLEPDHQIRSTTDDLIARALLPRGEDDMHFATGIGIGMERFQIDLAVDFADRTDTVSLSAIYNF